MTILRLALAVLSSVMVVFVDSVEDDVDTIMPRLYRELHKYSCKTEAMIDAIHMAKRNDVSLEPLLFVFSCYCFVVFFYFLLMFVFFVVLKFLKENLPQTFVFFCDFKISRRKHAAGCRFFLWGF